MPAFPGFIGPTGVERSVAHNVERTINLYPRAVQPGTPKSRMALYGTPGLRIFAELGGSPVYGLWSQDNRCFAVAGSGFYEIFADGTNELRGTVRDNDTPATIVSNGVGGNQLMVIAGERLYCYDLVTNELTLISGTDALSASVSASPSTSLSPSGSPSDEAFPERVIHGDYIDGYFVVLAGDIAHQLYISALNDGTSWDLADTAQVSSSSNRVLGLICDHREIWLFGTRTSEVWVNTGDKDFPFGPLQGVFLQFGTCAAYTITRLDNTLFWLGGDERGEGKVYRMNGYVPQRISTHAVEYALGRAGEQLSSAMAYAYEEEGHAFYVIYLPVPTAYEGKDWTTWVYDCATGLWHERATWNTDLSIWEPHRGRCHCLFFSKHLIGDRDSGTVYHQSLDYYDEEIP